MPSQSRLHQLKDRADWLQQLLMDDQMPPEEEPLRSTEQDLLHFLDSDIWKDMCDWIDQSIRVMHGKMEGAKNYPELTNYQGHLDALRTVRILPKSFIIHLMQEQDNESSPDADS